MSKLWVVVVVALAAVGSMLARPAPVHAAAGDDLKTISVRTVPPLAGVRVELDGVIAVTDAAGTLTFESAEFRSSAERMVVLDSKVDLPSGDGYHQYTRSFGASLSVVLGFDLYREASFRFETLQGRELGLDEIDSLQLKNTLGGRYEDVDRSEPLLLHANRVVSSPSGPIIRDVVWSVDSVMVGTSNVVNKSEIRFLPATETDILITALFFDAEFSVNDLLFGFATGEAVLVEDPGGVITRYPLEDGKLILTDLPRGEYRATVVGPGVKLGRPVALSRNQEVDLALLSYLDLVVVGLSGMLFASGTFVLGFRRRKKRRQAVGSKSTARSGPKFWRRLLRTLTRLRPWRRSVGTDLQNPDLVTTNPDEDLQSTVPPLVRTRLSPLSISAESVDLPGDLELVGHADGVDEQELLKDGEFVADPELVEDGEFVADPELVEDGEFVADPELVEDGELSPDPEFAVDPRIAGDHEFEYFLGIVDDVWAVGDLRFVAEQKIVDDLGTSFDLEIIDDVWSEPVPVPESLPLPPTLTPSGGRSCSRRSVIALYFSRLESAVAGLGRPETYTTTTEDDERDLVVGGQEEPAEDDERELVVDGPGEPTGDDERELAVGGPEESAGDDEREVVPTDVQDGQLVDDDDDDDEDGELVVDGPGEPAGDDEGELVVDGPGEPAEDDERELVPTDGQDGQLVDEDDEEEVAAHDDDTELAVEGETARSPQSDARWDVAS